MADLRELLKDNDGTFPYKPGQFSVTPDMRKQFERDGYIIVRSLLSSDELTKLKVALERDDGIMQHAFDRNDGHGRISRQSLWNHPGNDITGMVGRCDKVAGTMEKMGAASRNIALVECLVQKMDVKTEWRGKVATGAHNDMHSWSQPFSQLLEGEVYHYHTKLIMKEAHTGGSFVWHQDYGYWYKNGCLFPDMGTAFIAVDKCDQENGCLKVLRGSHRLGRIVHKIVGGQIGADIERVELIKQVLPLVHVELEPGDALFFHCNLLHQSDQNSSDRRRWAFLIAYNRASNNPVFEHHHPQYTPLVKVSDTAIIDCSTPVDLRGKDFMDPSEDHSVSASEPS